MQRVDLAGKMQTSKGFTHFLTALDVFSLYVFANLLRKLTDESVAKALFQSFMQDSFLLEKILSGLGTAFTFDLLKELCHIMQIKMKYDTVNYPEIVLSLKEVIQH